MQLELITTDDGTHTLFHRGLEEVYHSKNGAMAESQHVFVRAGFEYAIKRFDGVRILEVGMGTGLNALLTAVHPDAGRVAVNYEALEPFPVDPSLIGQLNYAEFTKGGSSRIWEKIHSCPWGKTIELNTGFEFLKLKEGIEQANLPELSYNLVYFDAFAPDIQPRLWLEDIFAYLNQAMVPGGIFVTYSAKGEVRRRLERHGFNVERIPGPKGKREMIRAIKKVSE